MSQVLKAAQSTGHGYLFSAHRSASPGSTLLTHLLVWRVQANAAAAPAVSLVKMWPVPLQPYQAVKPEVSLEAFVAISMAVFAVVSPVVYPVVCLAKCLEVDRESPRRPEYGSLIEDAQK